MELVKAIKYFEDEVRFCERAPAGNIAHLTSDWTRILDASKTALEALREKQAREDRKNDTASEHPRSEQMRDFLIDLIDVTQCHGSEGSASCPNRLCGDLCGKVQNLPYCATQNIADHLLANGVGLMRLIPVEEKLPERDERCLCRYVFGEGKTMAFYQVLDYYAYDPTPHFQHTLGDNGMRVTHWMPLMKLLEEVQTDG